MGTPLSSTDHGAGMAKGAEPAAEVSIVVWGAVFANLAIAIAKYAAAAITGSSALLSEAIHSTADTGNELLLIVGVRLSRRPADEEHPFGRSQEIYFWGLIVAMVLFGLGGGASFYEGIQHILHPHPLESARWNYVVLGVAWVFESFSFTLAAREISRAAKAQGQSFWSAARGSKDPQQFLVLFEDAAALLGIVVAFIGVFASHVWNQPVIDGVSSVVIGLILAATALLLAYECRSLLLGESAGAGKVDAIRAIVQSDPAVDRAARPLTKHLGPSDILVALDVDFKVDLSSSDVEAAVPRIEAEIRRQHADVGRIFIEARSLGRQPRKPS
jgi:cation diffusion facilitator family transporter